MGVEREGGNAIADYLSGRSTTDTDFIATETDPSWSTERRGGSANLDMIANAGALLWDRGGRQVWVDSWLAYFAHDTRTFQRSEPWSVIYSGWHLIPVLAVYRWAKQNNHASLEVAAKLWLRNWWALCALSAGSHRGRPHLVLTGARSSGVPLDVWYSHRAAWCEALGEWWSDRGQSTDPTNGWCNVALAELSPEILETSGPIVAAYHAGRWMEIVAMSPQFPMRGGGNLYRTASGVVSWLERDINGNTAGVLAQRNEAGTLWSMPLHGGPHWRQRRTDATCDLTYDIDPAGQLVYRSPHAALGTYLTMLLPAGEPLYHVRIDEQGWEVLRPQPEPVVVDPTPRPYRPPRPSRKRRDDKGKIAVGAIGLIALLGSLFNRKPKKEKP